MSRGGLARGCSTHSPATPSTTSAPRSASPPRGPATASTAGPARRLRTRWQVAVSSLSMRLQPRTSAPPLSGGGEYLMRRQEESAVSEVLYSWALRNEKRRPCTAAHAVLLLISVAVVVPKTFKCPRRSLLHRRELLCFSGVFPDGAIITATLGSHSAGTGHRPEGDMTWLQAP